nr:ATP-binding protein [Parabacteroides sp. ZJ-118]
MEFILYLCGAKLVMFNNGLLKIKYMLLEFTVENYRSFYERKTIVMEADKALKECAETNLFECNKHTLLRSLALYGANSSGKSNLVSAMHAMAGCVLLSVKLNDNEGLAYDPFLLLEDNHRPTMFEIIFLKGKYCYRYGFRYNMERIVDEWLFRKTTPRSKEQIMFVRNEEGICVDENNFPEGSGYEEKTNNNRLFLSLCQQLGGEISRQVISWFQSDFNVISGLNNQQYRTYSKLFFHKKGILSTDALKFFQKLRLGFRNILTHEEEPNIPQDLPIELRVLFQRETQGKKNIELDSVHNVYSDKGKIISTINFSFEERESSGTNKLFDLSGPIFDTLYAGAVLVVDELDAKMHPLISQYIIELFNNSETNPKNAQLIFTTHDTHLLSQKILRRDQIWFTEKDAKEQTDLYSLTDIVLPDGSKPRNDANYEKNYIAGRYGAIPYILND